MRSHYETLGVGKSATAAEIKKAYQRKAKQHHPDKGGAHADFVELKLAYEVLSDPERRAAYDSGTTHGANVEQMVEQVFNSFAETNDPVYTDPVLLTRHHFREQLYLQSAHVRECRKRARRWREIARRLHADTRMRNAVRQQRIRNIGAYLGIRGNRVLLRAILEYMEDWSFRVDEPPVRYAPLNGWVPNSKGLPFP